MGNHRPGLPGLETVTRWAESIQAARFWERFVSSLGDFAQRVAAFSSKTGRVGGRRRDPVFFTPTIRRRPTGPFKKLIVTI
ncbi:MAG: hypothetical protein MI923_14120 [Phycisphaerales bacterium]|nr:hypothetical protein [Phycisphaerales bacterium]